MQTAVAPGDRGHRGAGPIGRRRRPVGGWGDRADHHPAGRAGGDHLDRFRAEPTQDLRVRLEVALQG